MVFFPATEASQIIEQVSRSAKSFFPETPLVFGTLGNSDAKQDYYQEVTSCLARQWPPTALVEGVYHGINPFWGFRGTLEVDPISSRILYSLQ